MGVKSKTHFHTPINSRWWKCAWLEQVTRVELAGNSLGSCRHTARRHLHFHCVPIILVFFSFVNGFFPPFSFSSKSFTKYHLLDTLCTSQKTLKCILVLRTLHGSSQPCPPHLSLAYVCPQLFRIVCTARDNVA